MALIGISLLVASVVFFCLRPPAWLPGLFANFRQGQGRTGPPPARPLIKTTAPDEVEDEEIITREADQDMNVEILDQPTSDREDHAASTHSPPPTIIMTPDEDETTWQEEEECVDEHEEEQEEPIEEPEEEGRGEAQEYNEKYPREGVELLKQPAPHTTEQDAAVMPPPPPPLAIIPTPDEDGYEDEDETASSTGANGVKAEVGIWEQSAASKKELDAIAMPPPPPPPPPVISQSNGTAVAEEPEDEEQTTPKASATKNEDEDSVPSFSLSEPQSSPEPRYAPEPQHAPGPAPKPVSRSIAHPPSLMTPPKRTISPPSKFGTPSPSPPDVSTTKREYDAVSSSPVPERQASPQLASKRMSRLPPPGSLMAPLKRTISPTSKPNPVTSPSTPTATPSLMMPPPKRTISPSTKPARTASPSSSSPKPSSIPRFSSSSSPSPSPGLMAPPPAPRIPSLSSSIPSPSSSSPAALSRSRNLPIPNRGGAGAGISGLAPPPTHSAIPKKPTKQVKLTPGHSPMDWARLANSPTSDLRNLPAGTPYLKVTPSMLKKQTGRKGKDAWSVLGGKVYNFTPYVPFHPGGEAELLRGAGRDGTKMFGEIHPWVNYETMLSACLIGIMVEEHDTGNKMEDMD